MASGLAGEAASISNAWARAGFAIGTASLPAFLLVLALVPFVGGLADLLLPASVALPLLGVACSGLGFVRAARHGGQGRRRAVLGLVVSVLSTALYVANARSTVTPNEAMRLLRSRLHAGMTVREVLGVVDAFQAEHHGFLYMEVSGTTQVLGEEAFWGSRDPSLHVQGRHWASHERSSTAELDAAAERLSVAPQIWILGRTMPGYLGLSIELGPDRRAVSVSRVSGRAS